MLLFDWLVGFSPKSLDLTSLSESTILNNLAVFEMNGFQFQIDEEGLLI